MIRENLKIGAYATVDMNNNEAHVKSHEYRLNMRAGQFLTNFLESNSLTQS